MSYSIFLEFVQVMLSSSRFFKKCARKLYDDTDTIDFKHAKLATAMKQKKMLF